MELAVVVIYGLFLSFIFLYSLVQLNLAISYRKYKKNGAGDAPCCPTEDNLPHVTVQLPVYNELYVVERLIDCVAELDYPADKLEIQVLDDSTDESFDVAAKRIQYWRDQGVNMIHVKRPERKGFKAGALAYGLTKSKGQFTAIFDADFLPKPEFLRTTIPYFLQDDKIGVVQTKWEHINQEYSLLTKLQAFGLDAHFTVEQMGRNRSGHFINFNGTAGVWRNECIEDAGGWQSDTITEDLDLSYRAQMKGWKFKYLADFGSPAELPAEMNALKSQQFRWTKGAAECAKKHLPNVIKQDKIGFSTKIHALFHLMNSFIFICVLCTAILSIPMLIIKSSTPEYDTLFNVASIFLLSFLILGYFYWISHEPKSNRLSGFIKQFPLFLSVSMGLSLHNSIAVIEGYMGKKTPFIRTPKFAISNEKGTWSDKKYRALKASPLTVIEGLFAIYFASGLIMAFVLGDFALFPFHLMLTLGYGYVFYYSLKHTMVGV
ncbi:MAG: glycosyltransferase [Flavobacteriales bacterium]|nr:glycosyltransferase [Flavobacteriales bacterium]